MKIVINSELENIELKNTDYLATYLEFLKSIPASNKLSKAFSTEIKFPRKDNVIYHEGYLQYLGFAWANHKGVIISPEIIWYIILCEIAGLIKESPEDYRFLFSSSPEKQNIIIPCNDVEGINPALIIELLKNLVPSDINLFFPKFSTAGPESDIAFNIAFCDLVSVYYNYFTLACGIPEIEIRGTIEDWNKLCSHITKIAKLTNKWQNYLNNCLMTVNDIIANLERNTQDSVDFWKRIFYSERCGSGHQQQVNGWILNFIQKYKGYYIMDDNLPTYISKINWKNIDTGREFELKCGLFESKLENNTLIPKFSWFTAPYTS